MPIVTGSPLDGASPASGEGVGEGRSKEGGRSSPGELGVHAQRGGRSGRKSDGGEVEMKRGGWGGVVTVMEEPKWCSGTYSQLPLLVLDGETEMVVE